MKFCCTALLVVDIIRPQLTTCKYTGRQILRWYHARDDVALATSVDQFFYLSASCCPYSQQYFWVGGP